jgi:hypothetical protein
MPKNSREGLIQFRCPEFSTENVHQFATFSAVMNFNWGWSFPARNSRLLARSNNCGCEMLFSEATRILPCRTSPGLKRRPLRSLKRSRAAGDIRLRRALFSVLLCSSRVRVSNAYQLAASASAIRSLLCVVGFILPAARRRSTNLRASLRELEFDSKNQDRKNSATTSKLIVRPVANRIARAALIRPNLLSVQ